MSAPMSWLYLASLEDLATRQIVGWAAGGPHDPGLDAGSPGPRGRAAWGAGGRAPPLGSRLRRLIALCPAWHEITHMGLAQIRGRAEDARTHLMVVNGWGPRRPTRTSLPRLTCGRSGTGHCGRSTSPCSSRRASGSSTLSELGTDRRTRMPDSRRCGAGQRNTCPVSSGPGAFGLPGPSAGDGT